MPGERLSATPVVVKLICRGAVPDVTFAVSQIGSEAVFRVKKAPVTEEVTLTVEDPGVPEPLTYESEMLGAAGMGVTLNGLGGTTCRVTRTSLSGPGAFWRCRLTVCVVPEVKPPHPAAAATVNVLAVDVAVPAGADGLIVSQAGSFAEVVSRVNGVPPAAAEVTETVCAGPGV